jgi:regulator of protease activity HflC (stomatin/prohibitin superfamily)
MAHVTKRLLLSHFRGGPTDHVVHYKRGKITHEGVGQAFWFRPLSAAFSEVPTDDRELPLLFHGQTLEFQDVAVQAAVTYRFSDPAKASRRLDFALDPLTGAWRATPLDQIATLLGELAQQHATALLGGLTLTAALTEGAPAVRARVSEGLSGDERLRDTGIAIVDVRVLGVKAESEVERALRTPARELIQQEADRAGFERRAQAVNQERAIAENELQNRIELAVREEQLLTQQGANERRRATEAAAAEQISAQAEAQRLELRATADARETMIATEAEAAQIQQIGAANAARIRQLGTAEAEIEAAKINVYENVDPRILLALAVRTVASHLPRIGTVNLSPDLLSTALSQLVGNGAVASGRPGAGAGAGAAAPDRSYGRDQARSQGRGQIESEDGRS